MKLEAARCAKILLGCYRTGDANDPEVYVQAAISVLSEYPLEVIKSVCDPRYGLPAKSKWLPTVFEIKSACEAEMAPIDRRNREAVENAERKRVLAVPAVPRPTLAEMKAKYGENWGIGESDQKRKRAVELTLDDMCRQAGISREEFEVINDAAVKNIRAAGR